MKLAHEVGLIKDTNIIFICLCRISGARNILDFVYYSEESIKYKETIEVMSKDELMKLIESGNTPSKVYKYNIETKKLIPMTVNVVRKIDFIEIEENEDK